MTVTAIAHEAIAVQKLMQMVSECSEWQVAVGQTAAAGAPDYIFFPEKKNETEAQQEAQDPPVFAVIKELTSETDLVAGGGKNYFLLRGSLELQLIRQINDFTNLRDESTEALNLFGAVRTHLLNFAAVDDYLAITSIQRQEMIQSSDKNVSGYAVQKPFHKSVYLIEWGPGV